MSEKKSKQTEDIVAAIDKLQKKYGEDELICALEEAQYKLISWKPGCNKERSYTYQHAVEVRKCPQNEKQEAVIEDDAKKLSEDKVKRLCKRNKNNCTDIEIIDSSPTSGGCNCVSIGFGKKCVYTCMWTVKYKCKQAPT